MRDNNKTRVIKKVLIVGLGSIGKRHLEVIKDFLPTIEVIALRHNLENCKKKKNDVDFSYNNIDDAILQKPDIAIITNPASEHVSTAIKLAKEGIHLLIEKPLSNDLNNIDDLLKLCFSKNIKLMTGYNLRFLPCLLFLKEQVEEKKIGKILSIQAQVGQNLKHWRPGSDYTSGVSARKDLGGGVLLELSHEIDYLIWIFGKVNWVMGSLSHQSNLKIDVEDTANILMGLKAKAFNNNDIDVILRMDFTRHDHFRNLTIIGEQGTLSCDLLEGKVDHYCHKSRSWKNIFLNKTERNFTFLAQIKSFIRSIEDDTSPQIEGKDGQRVLKVIDAIRNSSTKSQKIFLS